ncbi:indolepyruvate oxidoreductase subunit IorB (plasmid) [Peptoclostridium acidaminophilum DSM 3953]|uniref:Indolepyruvate oxidoreductase subunit IorB n=1 Tax=Peptoclostridium acidaminophilum DSM 3953 TaxID=1286171 RepID=W8UBS2_PEPAC|nr:indolepyruvate oxidoreductase subunit beta [Peptoclostridium acidaminophilum]AHM58166.1 indolepyruvate oxidoreductase subunit IorB [Peptoclostridium acidaminophilum DSM 3953]
MSNVKSVLLVGVGGQGIILASQILSSGLIEAGFDVKMSEVHGMAQRGGSVTTQVRYGDKVDSPIIGKGSADVMVAFEKVEAVRWLEYLKPGGALVVNNYEIPSATVISGAEAYPDGVMEKLEATVENIYVIDAAKEAMELGNIKAQNIVLLGGLIKAMGVEGVDWDKMVEQTVKPRFVDLNLKAINKGMELVASEVKEEVGV